MAQKNDMVLKRRVLVDGDEIPGLVECSDLSDEETTAEVPGFDRTVEISTKTSKFAPLTMVYKIQRDTITLGFFRDWKYKNEIHDVTIIDTDGTGAEHERWELRDCECSKYNKRPYNAGGVEFYGLEVMILCSTAPVATDA